MSSEWFSLALASADDLPLMNKDDSLLIGESRGHVILKETQGKRIVNVVFLSLPLPSHDEVNSPLHRFMDERPGWKRRGWGLSRPLQPLPPSRIITIFDAFRVESILRPHRFGQYAAHLTNLSSFDALAVAYQQIQSGQEPHQVEKAASGTFWRWNERAHDLVNGGLGLDVPRRRYLNLEALPDHLRPLSEAMTLVPLSPMSTVYTVGLWPLVKRRLEKSGNGTLGDLLLNTNSPSTNFNMEERVDGLPDDPLVKAETLVHLASHFVLALLGLLREPHASSLRDVIHADRLHALEHKDEVDAFAVAAELVDEWRPHDLPAI
jgi:hypothetical protein